MKIKNFFVPFTCLLIIALTLIPFAWVSAQQPTPSDDEVNAIARQLFCPVCENTPLDVCPTQACHDWRELIRQMLTDGKTPNEIKQYFVEHYGARVLAEPPTTGINWLVYVLPPVTFMLGVFLLLRAFYSWKKVPKEPASETIARPQPANEDEYASRFEEELRRRK
ncbi:MAG: cytochrome c-type biogenesis protein CcmH [Anaerolineales bacterium]|jgi:cytochrome c-type biogenesis protein CcmH